MKTEPTPALLGWDDAWAAQLRPGEIAGRVLVTHRGSAVVCTPSGTRTLVMPDPIAVAGDWVTVSEEPHRVCVGRVLERKTLIRRRAANDVGDQFLAANVGHLLSGHLAQPGLQSSPAAALSAVVGDSGAESVVVLTKADLCPDPWARCGRSSACCPRCRCCARQRCGGCRGELDPWLGPGRTISFFGTSGVGKSSLVNALMGSEVQEVRSQRETTTEGGTPPCAASSCCSPRGGAAWWTRRASARWAWTPRTRCGRPSRTSRSSLGPAAFGTASTTRSPAAPWSAHSRRARSPKSAGQLAEAPPGSRSPRGQGLSQASGTAPKVQPQDVLRRIL